MDSNLRNRGGRDLLFDAADIDGGYILGGVRDTGVLNLWLLKADANGDSLWSRQFGGAEDDGCFSVRQASDGGFILGGETCSYGNPSGDAWILRLGPELSAPDRTVPRDFCALTNYPNPFNSATTIDLALPVPSRVRVQVYDILGRSVGTISDASYPSGQHTIPWRCPTCASGTYWISMRGDGFYLVRKAILLR